MQHKFDIVGDIHGQLDALLQVLQQLGYEDRSGTFFAPRGRKLISVGDVINKGPHSLECLELLQRMQDAGQAEVIIGNHEINAIHYEAGLRPKNTATTKQFSKTLEQIEADPERWKRAEQFILSLPNRLELDGGALRIVHAHWPEDSFPVHIDEYLVQSTGLGGPLYHELQKMVKGPEEDSPPYIDRHGVERLSDRRRWWESYPSDAPFIAFGHYCFPWQHRPEVPSVPTLLGPNKNAVCLDYGAGSFDRLVALRYPELDFVVIQIQG